MYYNDYNLQQLLELALRVPEIGAVNFNILYYILKTIIQNHGLEAVKPVFTLDAPLNASSTLKKSFSAESLKTVNVNEVVKKAQHDENHHDRKESKIEKQSDRWDKIKVSKRVHAVEDEISEMHILLARLEDKISNFDRVTGLLETKLMKEMADIHQSVKSKLESLENHALFSDEKLCDIDSKVSMLMTFKQKYEESSYEREDYNVKLQLLEQEISLKLERVNEELIIIKELFQSGTWDKSALEDKIERMKIADKDAVSKSDIVEIDQHLLNVSSELHRDLERIRVVDQNLLNVSSELHRVLERISVVEQSCKNYDEEFELVKDSCDEFVHSIEGLKENVSYVESEVTVLTEIPGMRNRIEQLEEYVYSGSDYRGKLEVGKEPERKESTEDEDKEVGVPYDAKIKFQTVLRDIALTQDMKKLKDYPKVEDLCQTFEEEEEEEEEYFDKEPEYEKTEDGDYGELDEVSLPTEPKKHSVEKIKSDAVASPDDFEEYSHQLKGQVIVFVKKRLHDFEIDLHNIKGNISLMREKVNNIEKYSKDIGEKLTFLDTSFNQRTGDLNTLKEMAENHQVSIASIMHHIDRKAEAYAVNQKVSRKELTVLEDRVLKLCLTSTSEISKLEEKIGSSIEIFNTELDKKLYSKEFKLQYDFLFHKLKVIENNLKDFLSEPPDFDFEGIRPIEIKKYVVCKNGTKQEQKKIAPWKTQSENIIPLLSQSLPDRQVSPKTAKQIQKMLESTSYRECKRFVEGAHTKMKVGRNNFLGK